MTSVQAMPAEEQVAKEKVEMETKDGKDSKLTLTNLLKKKQELVTKPVEHADLPETANSEQAPEDTNDQPAVTPAHISEPRQENVNQNKEMDVDATKPAENEAAAAPASASDQNEKKRKRAEKTPEQKQALEDYFANVNKKPSVDARKELATKIGLELNSVNRWFEEKRRKEKKAANGEQPAKRGRPSSADKSAEATEAPEKMEIDQPVAVQRSPEAEMADATQGGQEKKETPVAPAAAVAGPSQPSATAPSTSKKTAPVTLPGEEQRAKLLASLTEEAATLRNSGLLAPLKAIPTGDAITPVPFSDETLASYIVGQRLPLTELVAALLPLFSSTDSTAALTAEALRSRIVDLAVRKCYDPVDNPKGSTARLDALEAQPADGRPSLSQWELRDAKNVPKIHRNETASIKRRASKVYDRLNVVLNAQAALNKLASGGTTNAKAAKAIEALSKHDTLEKIHAAEEAERQAAANKEAAKAELMAMSAEEKKRAAAAKEAEKERLRKEKEEEKERARREKEEEKERLRKEKEEEKERVRKEKEKKKEEEMAKKTGFKDGKSLQKSKNMLMSFVKPVAPKAPSASPGATPAPGGSSTAPAVQLTAYQRRFPKPPPESLAPQPLQPLSIEKIDSALKSTVEFNTAESDWTSFISQNAQTRRTNKTKPPSGIGLPPSWARKSNAVEAAADRLRQYQSSGVPLDTIKTWRRKFIWFQGDSKRPPYYGSWPKAGPNIRPRNYLGQDETIDYEVMSDLDWEEEPEGSSLSGADDEEEGVAGEESEVEDSFMVADGYLSADEGVKSDEEMEGESAQNEQILAVLAAEEGGDQSANAKRMRAFTAMRMYSERAQKSGKPLVVLRDDVAAKMNEDEDAGNNNIIKGDSSVLEALAMEILVPGVSFMPAEDPATIEPASAAAGVDSKKKSAAGGAGRSKTEDFEDLLPNLAIFIQQNANKKKDDLIKGFIEAHPERKMTKKKVGEQISRLAKWAGSKWVMQPQQQQLGASKEEATPGGVSMNKLLTSGIAKGVPNTKPTPVVPTVLRPHDPPSNFKVPERLVTTTAAGEADKAAAVAAAAQHHQALPALVIPSAVQNGTSDEFWPDLLQHIEADNQTCSSFLAAFENAGKLENIVAALPAFIIDALLIAATGSIREESARLKAIAAVQSLKSVVDALVQREVKLSQSGEGSSESQRAWGEARSGSHAVSLAGLCREHTLLSVFERCFAGELGSEACHNAAKMVVELVACPAIKEISKEDAEKATESMKKAGDAASGALKAWTGVFSSS